MGASFHETPVQTVRAVFRTRRSFPFVGTHHRAMIAQSSGARERAGQPSCYSRQMKVVYLVGAALGALIPWYFNVLALQEIGGGFTPRAFFMVGFEGSPMLGSVAADFWIGSTISFVWMIVEARRLGMKRWWVFVVWTFAIAWASALPLFFFLRERHLEREASRS